MATTLQAIVQRRAELGEDFQRRESERKAFLDAYAREMKALAEGESLLIGGLDLERIQRARGIIDVYGRVSETRRAASYMRAVDQSPVRSNCLAEAKADLANGGGEIGRQYFGVKNYDAFGDQRCDCEYGMGPRHGSIVFSVGLTRPLRDRIRTGPHLEYDEIEDALYLLGALSKIEQLQAEAQKQAA